MNLYKKLRQVASYADKYTYDELVEKLKYAAEEGKYSMEVYQEDVLESDLEKLKSEGLKVEFIEGRDYNYYSISWE